MIIYNPKSLASGEINRTICEHFMSQCVFKIPTTEVSHRLSTFHIGAGVLGVTVHTHHSNLAFSSA